MSELSFEQMLEESFKHIRDSQQKKETKDCAKHSRTKKF